MKFLHQHKLLLFTPFLIFSLSMLGSSLQAQTPDPATVPTKVVTDSVEFAFLPALAYNSDFGLMGGGIMSRYHFKENVRPFHSYLTIFAVASTKGLFTTLLFFDKPNVFNSNQRLSSEVYISRFFQNQYYGIGNYSKLADEPAEKPDYYLYKSFTTEIEFILRRPLIVYPGNSQIDIYGLVNLDYRTPWGDNADRLITEDQPLGINGARTVSLGTGLIWENRDNEFEPTKGTYAKAGIEIGQKFMGSSLNFLKMESEIRAFTSFHLIRDITFANRLSFNHTFGSVPYWKLAELGGEETMRGYPENRFRDDNALFLNTELRTWLWEFPEYNVKLGGTLFADIGRTFPNGIALENVFNDLKYTLGFGTISSFFNENFILRGDVGFSDEGYGIYLTSGFLF